MSKLSISEKREMCEKYIGLNAEYFLIMYYKIRITNAHRTECYFMKFGGDNWKEKYESSKDNIYFNECINGKIFKEELEILKKYAIEDMLLIIEQIEENENIFITENDLYYEYSQYESIYRKYCNV